MLHPFQFILLRSPLQSLQKAYHFSENIQPMLEEGLYLSSPDFWNELQKKEELTGKDKAKLELTFAKYWLRSCTRCTPYGTFAGSFLSTLTEEETSLILNESSQHIRSTRLDMNYMIGILQELVQLPQIRDQLKLFTNNSLYELPGSFRYAEYFIKNNNRNYQLTSIEKTDYIQDVLKCAQNGATIDELTKLLITTKNVNEEEAKDFIASLWDSQLLVPELEPCITGKEPLDQLIIQLEAFPGVEDLLSQLKKIQYLIQNPKQGVNYYQEIELKLKNLGMVKEIPKNTLQVDLFLSTQNSSINKELTDTIVKQAEDLMYLSRKGKNAELDEFKTKFYSKYEDAEVPLSIALDADLGIGYAGVHDGSAGGGELIDDLAVGGGTMERMSTVDYIQDYTVSKYYDYLKNQKPFIEIDEDELKAFKKEVENHHFPNSMYLMGSLLKEDGLLNLEHFTFALTGFGGPSAGNLLGRFTHGNEQLCNYSREILKAEEAEYPEAIYAEIAHLPEARIGNILLRPVLRGYEIPYVGKSGAATENQIPVNDILVSISNNKLVLRSKTHNKRIIPRLTTAHNFGYKSLPIYKFLCDLQSQGIAHPSVWDWGSLSTLKNLPRVVYKNLIIQKAQWKIEEKDIKDLPKEAKDYGDYFQSFRKKWEIPQKVTYAEQDNELFIDFEHPQAIELFLHYLKRHKTITLNEFLFTEENCVVKDVHGDPYTNEVIIPVYRDLPVTDALPAKKEKTEQSIQRKFSLHSEWLYFKVYCGSKTAEKVLKETVLPFIEEGLENQLFEKFFFLRYNDEHSHFRIRFHNTDINKQLEVQKAFSTVLQPLLDDNTLYKVVSDTYNREVERYGADLVEEAEILFFNDSLSVLRFINLLEDAEEYRLFFALRGIDMLLDDFHLTMIEKKELFKSLQSGFFKEFGAEPALQKQLNEKYKKQQQQIFSHMNAEEDAKNAIEEAVTVFKLRSEMNVDVIQAILSKLPEDNLKERLSDLLSSYIHMYMNRLFIAQQRKYELIVYHFLERYYSSQVAMMKGK